MRKKLITGEVLEFRSIDGPGKGDDVPDILHAGNILDKPFEPKAETGVGNAAEFS